MPLNRNKIEYDYLINEFVQPLNIRWIDERPIYRQTFNLIGQTGGESVLLKATGTYEQVIKAHGWVSAGGGVTVGFPYSELSALSYGVVFEDGSGLNFEASATQVAPGGVVILEFTIPAGDAGGEG